MDYLIILLLIISSGLFSGLTIGLMGLSKTEVLRAKDLGDPNAKIVSKVIEDSNLLLVTLLLGNTAVNATLSLFLGSVVGTGIVAGIISTILILIFGEILPASIISKNALKIGAQLTPLVKILMFISSPISKPIAFILDKVVGKEGVIITSRNEIIHMVEQMNTSSDSDIDELDRKAIIGAITFSNKLVKDHLSTNPFTINSSDIINKDLIDKIIEVGYTRIPVINDKNVVVGILHAKDLLGININTHYKVKEKMRTDKILYVNANDTLDDVLHKFVKKGIHIAMVKDYDTVVGIITQEDISEEILLTEIVDEFDNNKGK